MGFNRREWLKDISQGMEATPTTPVKQTASSANHGTVTGENRLRYTPSNPPQAGSAQPGIFNSVQQADLKQLSIDPDKLASIVNQGIVAQQDRLLIDGQDVTLNESDQK